VRGLAGSIILAGTCRVGDLAGSKNSEDPSL